MKHIAYGVGTEGCFEQTGAAMVPASPDGDIDPQRSERRQYDSDLYYGALTAFDAVDHEVIGKAVTEIEIRVRGHGHRRRPRVHGTPGRLAPWPTTTRPSKSCGASTSAPPLKGAPVTYAIGPTQYVAVQVERGRHLHPGEVRQPSRNSSYLFVFALDQR